MHHVQIIVFPLIYCTSYLHRYIHPRASPWNFALRVIRSMLQENKVLSVETLSLCKSMADLRDKYAHGYELHPKEDALKSLKWMHSFIDNETNLMQDYVIVNGILSRKHAVDSKQGD